MHSVYVNQKGFTLSCDKHVLTLSNEEAKQTIAFKYIDRIIVGANTLLDTHLIGVLNEHNIPLIVLNRRQSNASFCGGWHHGNHQLRLWQYQAYLNSSATLFWSARLVVAKILQQKKLILRLRRTRPEHRFKLSQILQALPTQALIFSQVSPAQLLGYEGHTAKLYFQALALCLPPSLNFIKRERRPPKDPANSTLSLTYTLLMSDGVAALYSAGLDPSLGFHHRISYNRQSLACDLIELFRATVDTWVLHLFNQQTLTPEHFYKDQQGACLMKKNAKAIYYPAWEALQQALRPRMLKQAEYWARLLKGQAGQKALQ